MLETSLRTLVVACSGMMIAALFVCASAAEGGEKGNAEARKPVLGADLHIRDPFVVPVPKEQTYYVYGTCISNGHRTFATYTSKDLKEWFGPVTVFQADEKFWGDRDYWAPEVHSYRGKYYMFASFRSETHRRATHILVADTPKGPFKPLTDSPVTPPEWECLDGTLFIDETGAPWMVFCHEWVQTTDGEMCAMRLTPDLKEAAGKPILLFRASEAPWVQKFPGWPVPDPNCRGLITDGPFLHRTKDGTLLMLWSSFGADGYKQGVVRSTSGHITGPWKHDPEPLFADDGGHGMLFKTFDGKLMLTLHQPNLPPNERLKILPVGESGGQLIIGKE